MQDVLNDISRDRAFINGFKAQMAYYKHMCRIAELPADRLKLYSAEVQETARNWNKLNIAGGI